MGGKNNCVQLFTFMHTYNLVSADLSYNIKYTYQKDYHASFSWPDYIVTYHHYEHLINCITCSDDAVNFF